MSVTGDIYGHTTDTRGAALSTDGAVRAGYEANSRCATCCATYPGRLPFLERQWRLISRLPAVTASG